MGFAHSCSFCGWGRSSRSPVMLEPCCPRCGCALDAVASTHEAGGGGPEGFVLPRLALSALRWAGVALALLALYAATAVGYRAAGAAGALIAFGLGAFLAVPFVPQRLR